MTHTELLLEQSLRAAEKLGYRVRIDWLDGVGGGPCEAAGERWLFLDRGLSPQEQLNQVARVLPQDPQIYGLNLPQELSAYLGVRKSA